MRLDWLSSNSRKGDPAVGADKDEAKAEELVAVAVESKLTCPMTRM